jgi:hypothetical protein
MLRIVDCVRYDNLYVNMALASFIGCWINISVLLLRLISSSKKAIFATNSSTRVTQTGTVLYIYIRLMNVRTLIARYIYSSFGKNLIAYYV